MKFVLTIILVLFSSLAMASVSKQTTQQIFNKMIVSNGIRASLSFSDSNEINAYTSGKHIVVLRGMLKYADRDVMIAVLAHELGHSIGYNSELQADRVSGRIAAKAGMNVCPGAYKFFVKGPGRNSNDGIHPDGLTRWKAMCKKI